MDFFDKTLNWIAENYFELISAIFGLFYIYFSIKRHILLWLFGILSCGFYVAVFYDSMFYADMSLQAYYVVVSIYGWIIWKKKTNSNKPELKITDTNIKTALVLFVTTVFLYIIWVYILLETPTDVPYGDAFTTALGVTGTWMLAKKKIEHWFVWLVANPVAVYLYFFKELYPTAILYIVLSVLSITGFIQWKKELKSYEK